MTTTGRRTGQPRPVALGFMDDPVSGGILVAATEDAAAWTVNIDAEPRVRVDVGDRSFYAVAERLDVAEHRGVVRDLILKYGTPSEGLGRGPSYRLRPVGEAV